MLMCENDGTRKILGVMTQIGDKLLQDAEIFPTENFNSADNNYGLGSSNNN